MNILYIEDDAMDRKIFERASKSILGHNWFIASSFQEGIEKLQHEPIELIIIDGYLPDGDPEKMLDHTKLPVIVLSGAAYENKDQRFKAVLLKPIQTEILEQTLSNLNLNKTDIEDQPSMKILSDMAAGDVEFEIEMLTIYLTELPNELAAISELSNQENWEATASLVHKLKSKIGLMDMPNLRVYAQEIENKCRQQEDLAGIPRKVERLIRILQQSITFAQAELEKRKV